jgi:ferrous iron transport protein A
MTPQMHTLDGTVSLASMEEGLCARLVAVEAGTSLRTRLVAMGLRTGCEVRVVRNGGRGPFVVALGSSRIVLGRGMAHQVRVVPVAQCPEADLPTEGKP